MTPEERRAGFERERVQRAEALEHDRADRAMVVRKKDLRFRVEMYVLYAVSIGLTMVSIAFAFWVADVVTQINRERVRNTVAACQRDSTRNEAIVGFVVDGIAASPTQRHKLLHPEAALRRGPPYSSDAELNAYILRAVKTFPTFTDRECERRAAERVQAG